MVVIRQIRSNDELNNLIRNKNMINDIGTQKFSWFGHVYRLTEDKVVKKLYDWKPKSGRLTGRPKSGMKKPYKRGFMNNEYEYLYEMDPDSGYGKAETIKQ